MDWSQILEMVKELIPERENVLLIMKHYHITKDHLLPMLSQELITFLNEQDTTPYWHEYKLDHFLWKKNVFEIRIDDVEPNYRSDILKDMVHSVNVWYNLHQKLDTWLANNSKYLVWPDSSHKTHLRFTPRFDHVDPERIRESTKYIMYRGCSINARDNYGRTLLHEFLYKREGYNSIQHVLEMKADPNISHGHTNKTCLEIACEHHHDHAIVLLIDHGAVVQQTDINMFITKELSHVLQRCLNMGFDIYWSVDRFLKNNPNRYTLPYLNRSIDRTSISTIKQLLQREERQFYMQVDSLWSLILSFVHTHKKRKLYLHLQIFTSRIITIVTCDIGYMFS
jgi:hypothetical protein